ncbi:GbsR/MarR family transcriptional regulator [Marixanthomonas spongiae]|uniref:Transcriptional regulator n=1 Tax=Marixanthomonas spongiae TaxID=2174845 RepID=A0A2U0I2C4_9FLAO|nr:transcriptional regulator [Marixanthomonas spongiae]PVW15256.1 transcriptional regulator [Marixanthomonas spongiae]
MQNISEEKCKLVEELGLSFEDNHNLPPLAGRIYAVMILSSVDGHSFEDIIEITSASKSSVSTNLNLLVQLKFIEYFTKTGDRKRYFRTTKNYLRLTLEEHYESIDKELELVKKVNTFNKKHNPEKFKKNKNIGLIFQEYLTTQKENLETTIKKMIAFNNEFDQL